MFNCLKVKIRKFENRSKAVNRVRKRGCQLRVKEAVKTYEIGLKRGREKRAFKGTKSVQNRRSKLSKFSSKRLEKHENTHFLYPSASDLIFLKLSTQLCSTYLVN